MNLSLPASVGTGRVTDWLIAPGDSLTIGQPMAIFLTATQELLLPADAAGTVEALLIEINGKATPGEPLVKLTAPQAAPPPPKITPLARAIAAANHLEPATITGSGIAGRIVKRDVVALLNGTPSGFCVAEQIGGRESDHVIIVPQKSKPVPTPLAPQPPQSAPARPAGHVLAAPSLAPISAAPVALLAIEVDTTAIEHRCAEPLMARKGITPTVLMLHAIAQTLWNMPQMRVHWHDDGLIHRANVHLSLFGLSEPKALINAADLAPTGIARALLNHQQPLDEAPVCAVNVSSQGPAAAWWSDPRLPAGHTLLIHVGNPLRQPVVRTVEGQDQVIIRPIATLVLAFDIRAITPWQADQCMQRLKTAIEAAT